MHNFSSSFALKYLHVHETILVNYTSKRVQVILVMLLLLLSNVLHNFRLVVRGLKFLLLKIHDTEHISPQVCIISCCYFFFSSARHPAIRFSKFSNIFFPYIIWRKYFSVIRRMLNFHEVLPPLTFIKFDTKLLLSNSLRYENDSVRYVWKMIFNNFRKGHGNILYLKFEIDFQFPASKRIVFSKFQFERYHTYADGGRQTMKHTI